MSYSRARYEERLSVFLNDLSSLQPSDAKLLPDLTPQINHEGKDTHYSPLAPGFYTTTRTIGAIATLQPNCVATMEPDDTLKVSREDSRHQVFLGPFSVSDGSNSYSTKVAVKSQKAQLKELAMYQLFGSLNIPSFRPFAFIVAENGNQHLLTRLRQSVKTIDATEWKILMPEEIWSTASAGVRTMVLLHSHLLFHGDLEFRNVATNDYGNCVVSDPEFTLSLRDVGTGIKDVLFARNPSYAEPRDVALDQISRKMGKDFTAISSSIQHHVFRNLPHALRPKDPGNAFKLLEKHLYRPYQSEMAETDAPYAHVALAAFYKLYARRKDEARKGIL